MFHLKLKIHLLSEMIKIQAKYPIELFCWIIAMVLLYYNNPYIHHFTICPLENMGFDWCPGCGLGRSITFLLRGNVTESINRHWLGIPVLIIIIHRITLLTGNYFHLNKLFFKTIIGYSPLFGRYAHDSLTKMNIFISAKQNKK